MKKEMNLVQMTVNNTVEHFTRKQVKENLGLSLQETTKLDENLFKKFWKEFFPKVTLSTKQTEFILDFYEKSNAFKFNAGEVVVEMMDDFHQEYKLSEEQKWYYGVYRDKEKLMKKWDEFFNEDQLSEEYMRSHSDELDWDEISEKQKMSIEFVRDFSDKINWHLLSMNHRITEDVVREFIDKFSDRDFENFSDRYFSEEFIREFIDKLDIGVIFKNDYMSPFLSDKFFEDFSEDYEYWREYF